MTSPASYRLEHLLHLERNIDKTLTLTRVTFMVTMPEILKDAYIVINTPCVPSLHSTCSVWTPWTWRTDEGRCHMTPASPLPAPSVVSPSINPTKLVLNSLWSWSTWITWTLTSSCQFYLEWSCCSLGAQQIHVWNAPMLEITNVKEEKCLPTVRLSAFKAPFFPFIKVSSSGVRSRKQV